MADWKRVVEREEIPELVEAVGSFAYFQMLEVMMARTHQGSATGVVTSWAR